MKNPKIRLTQTQIDLLIALRNNCSVTRKSVCVPEYTINFISGERGIRPQTISALEMYGLIDHSEKNRHIHVFYITDEGRKVLKEHFKPDTIDVIAAVTEQIKSSGVEVGHVQIFDEDESP